MKEYIQKKIKEKGLQLSLLLIIFIVCINAIFVVYYRNVIKNTFKTADEVEKINDRVRNLENYIRFADIGARAFIIKQNESFLYPYNMAMEAYQENFVALEGVLLQNGYDVNKIKPAIATVNSYMQSLQLIVDLCRQGKVDEATDIFLEDRGYAVVLGLNPVLGDIRSFTEGMTVQGEKLYAHAINLILVIQFLLIIISVPILGIAYRKIVKDDKFRIRLFKHIDENNKRYLFDDGKEAEFKDEDSIIDNLVNNLKKAAGFINNITKGNYSIQWQGMEDKVVEKNKESIAGELIMMRDQMQKAKHEDEIRIWTNEGLSKFADLIRNYQDNISNLADDLISNIVEYLNAQQGGLFYLNDDDLDDKHLELVGCYAYQRKKFLEKRVELGQGMVGQCFLEAETTYLTNIPDNYVNITSGLGETNPNTLLIVPLKMNEEVVGVIEIANLKPFEKHQISFLERLAETIASAITTVKTNDRTKVLLEQSQQQAEEMRAQEEEMRQNMEELQATQEQMHRKNEEVEHLLKQASENEESMKLQMEALQEMEGEAAKIANSMKKEAEGFKSMLMDILNEVPEKVFLKDATGKIYIANQKVADAHGLSLAELIGKSDYDFVDKETADQWRKQELAILKKGEDKYIFEDKTGGKTRILETYKKAFYIKPLSQKGLLGIQRDITDIVNAEKLKKDKDK